MHLTASDTRDVLDECLESLFKAYEAARYKQNAFGVILGFKY